jgi:hypothetical protein
MTMSRQYSVTLQKKDPRDLLGLPSLYTAAYSSRENVKSSSLSRSCQRSGLSKRVYLSSYTVYVTHLLGLDSLSG